MKLINQSHEIINEPDKLKLIEIAGRLCWKSEDKITDDSVGKFVRQLVRRGHLSVIEHAHIAFKVDFIILKEFKELNFLINPIKESVIDDSYLTTTVYDTPIISGNLRAWKEFLSLSEVLSFPGIRDIARYLGKNYPEIFPSIDNLSDVVELMPVEEMSNMERAIHTTKSVRFITNRGVTHEMVRHRPCAISQESTRYVRYDGNMEFIRPVWWMESPIKDSPAMQAQKRFVYFCDYTEQKYLQLLNFGWKPQQAREVLSNSLKTEIIMTGTLRQWYHIFKLRCDKPAHPQIRQLMQNTLRDFIRMEPEIFEQQSELLN